MDFINKGIQIRSANPANANFGWRNPNFYLFRTQINNVQYVKLSNQYSAMTNEQKVGDEGKEVLKQVGTVIDKLIADYARAMAAANTADYKETKEDME